MEQAFKARSRRIACALAVAFALAGCAATVVNPSAPSGAAGTAPQPRIAPSTAAQGRIVWSIESTPEVMSRSDWPALVEEWNAAMPAAAQSVGANARAAAAGSPAGSETATRVKVKVNDFRYVSQAKRYAIGVFAGNASMDVDVEFTELPAGKSLGSRKYSTSSSFMQGVFSAMTPKQVQATSAEIVREVTGKEPVAK